FTNTNRSGVTVGKAAWQPTKQKTQPSKAVEIPSSSYTSVTVKNGGKNDPTSSSNIPTSNPYSLLSQEFDPENYSRSGGEPNSDQVDMKSEREVEVVFDKSVNLVLVLVLFCI
ncbi:hypothetical protein Tco_1468753, partial [Tanacetum coccineum]